MAITSLKFFCLFGSHIFTVLSGAAAKTLVCLAWGESVLLCGLWITPFVCRHTLTDPSGIWRGNPDGQAAEGGCFYKDKYRRDPYLSGSAFSDRRFALLQRDELLCDQWQYPASSAGKGKYLVPLADSSTAGDFLLYIKLYRIHFGCLLGRCQPAEEFFFLKFCLFGIYFPT